jgi:nucleolar protein 15
MPAVAKNNMETKLAVLDGPEWNSDDEAMEPEKPVETKKVKGRKPRAKKAAVVAKKEEDGSNVVYMGHIPTNFEEAELRGFLGQFGNVTALKLSRARKTSNPRGFGFVAFDDPEVAAVVADTMSGYLMGQKRVVCHVVPKDKVHPDLFKGAKKVFKKIDWAAKHRKKVNRPKSSDKMKEITQRLVSRERKKRDKLKELGIDYDFPGYAASNEAFPVIDDAPKAEIAVIEDKVEDKVVKFKPVTKKSKIEKAEPPAKKARKSIEPASAKKVKKTTTVEAIEPKKETNKRRARLSLDASDDTPSKKETKKTKKTKGRKSL